MCHRGCELEIKSDVICRGNWFVLSPLFLQRHRIEAWCTLWDAYIGAMGCNNHIFKHLFDKLLQTDPGATLGKREKVTPRSNLNSIINLIQLHSMVHKPILCSDILHHCAGIDRCGKVGCVVCERERKRVYESNCRSSNLSKWQSSIVLWGEGSAWGPAVWEKKKKKRNAGLST